ncbi:hypothetical protein D3C71_1350120 [compost metagenome]
MRVEHGHIGKVAFGQHSTALNTKDLGGQARHLPHGCLQRKQAYIAAVVAQYTRESAPQARMRALVGRNAVRADHGGPELEDALHIALVHAEVDGAGRLQTGRCFGAGDSPILGDLAQLLALQLRVWLAGSDQYLARQALFLQMQHGGAGMVGVAVERYALALHRRFDLWQGLGRIAPVGLARQLVV